MFIRWKVHTHWRHKQRKSHYAYLVHSQRNDDGQPRQHVVAYLGKPTSTNYHFKWWAGVYSTLNTFDLEDDERERIEDALAERYPKPTAEQVREEHIAFAWSILDKDEFEAWCRGELDFP